MFNAYGEGSGWLNSTSHTISSGKQIAHSPCEPSPPRLIRVKQTLTQHKSILHNQLQGGLISLSIFQLLTTQSLDTHAQHNFSCSLTCNKCFYRSMTLYYITCLVFNNICMHDILSCKPHHQSLDSVTCLENTSCRPYLVQTEIQKPDSFKNKTRGLLWVDVLHIPWSTETFMQLSVKKFCLMLTQEKERPIQWMYKVKGTTARHWVAAALHNLQSISISFPLSLLQYMHSIESIFIF